MTSNPSQFDPLEFSPAIPLPLIEDPQDRINFLRELLTQDMWQRQKANILKLIELYESGELKPPVIGSSIWLLDGEVVDHEPTSEEMRTRAVWLEGTAMQMMQQTVPMAEYSQMAQSASYGYLAGTSMHELFAQFRLDPQLGGNPNNVVRVRIANDSGSDIQTIFTSDLNNLNFNPNTYPHMGAVRIRTASGLVYRSRIRIQIQILNANGGEVTAWFPELAVITPDQVGLSRLSGMAMRHELYFATPRGNASLHVAVKKNGIVTQLPAL